MSQLLLAVDTSGKNGSLALARVTAGRSEVDVVEVVPLAGGTFSAQLIPQLSALLAKHGYTRSDLAGFAAVSGPGSFTGLRVGLAAIKALAEVLQKPIAAISLLEAIAWSAKVQGRVLAALDAGRSEVYAGDYEIGGNLAEPQVRMHSERLLSREEFLAEANGEATGGANGESTGEARVKIVVTPVAALVEILRAATIQVERIDYPTSAVIARLGWQRIQRGQTVRPEDLEANYIRRSDAEIFSQPKP
jgi:tRNA threonylcarbamoyladenosine biosynthesis protein TsaB